MHDVPLIFRCERLCHTSNSQDATAARLTLARIEATPDEVLAAPSPAVPLQNIPQDDPETQAGVLAHRLPEHLMYHPDPRVRNHWSRIYRKTNTFKQRYLQDPYGLVVASQPEGAVYAPND